MSTDSIVADPIAFIDLHAQQRRIGPRMEQAIGRVLAHGQYIMGPEVATLEQALAAFAGVRHAVTCANGTDALVLVLMAWGIGPGDAVFVPTLTFTATAEAVVLVGAVPVFCDVLPETANLAPSSLEAAIPIAKAAGLRPQAVIPVDLFGQPADYGRLRPIAEAHGLRLLADGAQSFGARLDGRSVGQLGDATATSFFPAKPLGCYGDGGAILTDDDGLAAILRSLRLHGRGRHKYDNVRIGMNSRLDTMQAAILLEKLSVFPEERAARAAIARRYDEGLATLAGLPVSLPVVLPGAEPIWAQYTVTVNERDAVAERLKAMGVPTAIYYPTPLHRQPAFNGSPAGALCAGSELPVADRLVDRVLSLPMYPYLPPETQDRIVRAVADAAKPTGAYPGQR